MRKGMLIFRCAAMVLLLTGFASRTSSGVEYPQPKSAPELAEEKGVELSTAARVPLLDRAVDPKTYIVGPGDVFVINLYGVTAVPIKVEVLPEGNVSIPDVGEINIGQITLEEAKARIASALMSRYRDRAIGVNLAQVRSFKVSVTGAVVNPNVVAVSASDRVSDAIALAGGLQRKASRRNIKLVNIGRDTVIADLAYFNATGRVDANPCLHEGQVVFVPVVSDSFNKVEVYGAVNSPGVFEYRPKNRISDLLALAFGVAIDADLDSAELVRFQEFGDSKTSISLNLRDIIADSSSPANLNLMPDDRLFVRAISGFRKKEQVTITGEVRYPGIYPIQQGTRTLKELVDKAGGLLPGASLTEAEMLRKSQEGTGEEKTSFDRLLQLSTDKLSDFEVQYLKETAARKPGRVAVDFELLLERNQLEHDVPLMAGDMVNIPSKSFAVDVMGRVVSPGLVPYKENQSVEYYIRLAGGYGYKADKGDIRIIKANTGSVIKPDAKTPVAMGDRIMVPQKKATDVWKFAKDVGFFLANIATVYVVVDQAIK